MAALKHVVNELSNSSTNLLRAEGALIFLLEVLAKKSIIIVNHYINPLRKELWKEETLILFHCINIYIQDG